MEGCDVVGVGDQLVLVPVLSDHDDVLGECDLLEVWVVRIGLCERLRPSTKQKTEEDSANNTMICGTQEESVVLTVMGFRAPARHRFDLTVLRGGRRVQHNKDHSKQRNRDMERWRAVLWELLDFISFRRFSSKRR